MKKLCIIIYCIFLFYSSVLSSNNFKKNNEVNDQALIIRSDEKPNFLTIPIHISAGIGNWSYLNNNQILGNRLIQEAKIGLRIKRLYLDYSYSILSGTIKKELNIFVPPDSLVKASYFRIQYTNFNLGYQLLKDEKKEIVVTAAIGRMNFSSLYRDLATDTLYAIKDLVSRSYSFGAEYRRYSNLGYAGIEGRYIVQSLDNQGGTPISGNSLVVQFKYGFVFDLNLKNRFKRSPRKTDY